MSRRPPGRTSNLPVPAPAAAPPARSRRPPSVARTALRPGGVRTGDSIFSAFRQTAHSIYYEAAEITPKQPVTVDVGPNGANGSIPMLRARSRRAFVNNGFFKQAVRQVANNVVGYGIQPVIPFPDLKTLWNAWSDECDIRGLLDYYGGQWFAVQLVVKDGESIIMMEEDYETDSLSGIPLRLCLVESDYMPFALRVRSPRGNWIIDGVERDDRRRIVGYWLFRRHPRDWMGSSTDATVPEFFPAADVIHMFMPDRPEAERGAPWLTPVLKRIEDLREYNANEIEKKKNQAKFTTFYKKPLDEEGSAFKGQEYDEKGPNFVNPPAGAAVEVPEGYGVEFPHPPPTDANYEQFSRLNLSEVAVAIGMCVEMITLDFKNVNDRLYRGMMLEVGRFIESIAHHVVVRQMNYRVWPRFVSLAMQLGLWTPPEGAKPIDYMRIEWRMPPRGHIHPLQEVMAFAEAVRNGFISRSKIAAEYGESIEDIDMDNARDMARAELLKLAYPVYPSLTDGSVPDGPETEASLKLKELERKNLIEALIKMVEAEGA